VLPTPDKDFTIPFGHEGIGLKLSMLARRHMHLYGTSREQLAEVAISTRANAIRRPSSLMTQPLTLEKYFAARMISDPLCLYDYCLETDGAVAVVTTSAERAVDLAQRPVYVLAASIGGAGINSGDSSFDALLPILKQDSSLPFLTVCAVDSALYPTPVPNVFMTQASATQQASALVNEARRNWADRCRGRR
jgi:hypothetical protein